MPENKAQVRKALLNLNEIKFYDFNKFNEVVKPARRLN
jgi:hypothetical protein